MASFTFTGVTSHSQINTSTLAVGSTRWNTDINCFEAFDGQQWTAMTNGRNETMKEMVQHLEDRIAVQIEEEYQDSVAIQDAYKEWEESNERFKIVLALAEKR